MRKLTKSVYETFEFYFDDNNYNDILDILKNTFTFETQENIENYRVCINLNRVNVDNILRWSYKSMSSISYTYFDVIASAKMENIYQQEIRKEKFKILLDENNGNNP